MVVAVLKEPAPETRVSLLAEAVATLTRKGIKVQVERGAGPASYCSDAEYEKAGAQISSADDIAREADIVLAIHAPSNAAILQKQGRILVGVYQPLYNKERTEQWSAAGLTVFSLDMLPRTTRAQAMASGLLARPTCPV